jgi:succinoglycan biosynthesis transport protein ExoP
VTTHFAGEASPFSSGSMAARVKRRSRAPSTGSLAMNRFKRGAGRQWFLVLFVALLIAGAGALYDVYGGAAWVPSLLFWFAIGAPIGAGIGVIREIGRNTITSPNRLSRQRGFTVLGAAPELDARALRELAPDQRSALGCLAYQAQSPFATAFRNLQGALTGDRLIAFIGPSAGEGATTAALCTAVSATQQGRNVIIVDCDIRRRSLTRGFGLEPELGVVEACERPEYWRDYVEHEAETGLHFLPSATPSSPWRSLIGEAGFPVLLKELQRAYDLVVLDCPPAIGNAEGSVIARMADRAVLVATWDKTTFSAIRQTLRNLRSRAQTTGILVNRVPPGYRFGRLRPG